MMKNYIVTLIFLAFSFSSYPQSFSLTEKEQQQIFSEAEDWIDEMPLGLNDKISDAVNHAMHGFNSEIEYLRNYKDTTLRDDNKVIVKDFQGGVNKDISLRLYYQNENKISPLLIFFHGGGWSIGNLDISDKFCRALASEGNVKIVSVDYPLAPENPYPAAINKCIEATEYILSQSSEWKFSKVSVSLGGDGAGGNLALETYYKLSDKENIKSLVLYYPLINTSGELDPSSKRKYGRGYGFDSRLWETFIEAYNGVNNQNKVEVPSTLLISAGRDIIIKEEKDFSLSSPNIIYVQFDGALHGFLTDNHQSSAFNKAVTLTDLFLTK